LNAGEAFALEDCGQGKECRKENDDCHDTEHNTPEWLQGCGQVADEPVLERDEDLVQVFLHGLALGSFCLGCRWLGCRYFSAFDRGGNCPGRGFGLGLGASLREAIIYSGRLCGMNLMVVLV